MPMNPTPTMPMRTIAFFPLKVLLFLRRQLADELDCALNPLFHLRFVLDPIAGDDHPSLHDPARDVEHLDVWFEERRFAFFWSEADDQILPDANKQISV